MQGQAAGSYYAHDFHESYLSPVYQPSLGAHTKDLSAPSATKHFYKKTFTFPFTEHSNNQRRYYDGGKLLLTSSDGTVTHMSGVLGKNQQLESKERYKFSYNHFGHYADILDVAKDSRYVMNQTPGNIAGQTLNRETISLTSSPITIKFVTGSIIENDTYYHEVTYSSASLNNSKTADLIKHFDDRD